ncbi:XRE family transcriptional regulator [Streptomyces sp. RB6PN25]|uniref:XRE family transcriptional regulator n=1 Tax=Streptomyces humicola TaxID=2953240 RepID=A0ABT1PTY5_9ACTN|nr:XRE family transcriptional regulator [Streptomyces humicola]MCQ4081131.1 XRE family transcriptional regulator [Streptomyces humicola]
MNHALRQALAQAGLSRVDVAACLEVDPKTVDRWIDGRVPHRRHRERLSALVGTPESDLWPDVGRRPRQAQLGPEILAIYPHRWQVPQDVWRSFFARAKNEIGVLVYSGLFLIEDAAVVQTWAAKAAEGVNVRLLLGDPTSQYVTTRGGEEGIGESMAARIRNALVLLRPVVWETSIEIRTHGTTLYNSILRVDNELLCNAHVYGQAATHSPVLHLRQTDEATIATAYLESFERVWAEASVITSRQPS